MSLVDPFHINLVGDLDLMPDRMTKHKHSSKSVRRGIGVGLGAQNKNRSDLAWLVEYSVVFKRNLIYKFLYTKYYL